MAADPTRDLREALLTEAVELLALRPSGHTGSMDDRIPWFQHGGISHGENRPDCIVCEWLARVALRGRIPATARCLTLLPGWGRCALEVGHDQTHAFEDMEP